MSRAILCVVLTLALLAAPLAAGAQPAEKIWRVGYLAGGIWLAARVSASTIVAP